MKPGFPITALMLLGLSACAHNPRPESPELRAERQAQSLQQQQNAQSDPRSVDYTAREDVSEDEQQAVQQNEQEQVEPATGQQARAQARQRATAVRGSLRSVTVPVTTGITGATGGIFR